VHQGHHGGARAPARGRGSESGSREGGAPEVGFQDGTPEEEVAVKVLGSGVPSGSRGGGAPELGFQGRGTGGARGRGADKEEEDRGGGRREGARRR